MHGEGGTLLFCVKREAENLLCRRKCCGLFRRQALAPVPVPWQHGFAVRARELSWRPYINWRKQVWFPIQVDSPAEVQETKSPGAELEAAEASNVIFPVQFLFAYVLGSV